MGSSRISWLERYFPGVLKEGYRKTSEASGGYNCIAYAAGDDRKWWSHEDPIGPYPRFYWPVGVRKDDAVEALQDAMRTVGFEVCHNGRLERGREKIAIFAKDGKWMHAARQFPDGTWRSKMGENEDIRHSLHAIAGEEFGQVVCYMSRPRLSAAKAPKRRR